jgi:hypothetical protein
MGDGNGEFGGVVSMITLEMVFIYGMIYLYHTRHPKTINRPEKTFFEMTGTHLLHEKYEWTNWILCATRFGSFLYFAILAWGISWARYGANDMYNYFTHWNIVLLTVYFFIASIHSIVYILAKNGLGGITNPPWQDVSHPLKDYPLIFGPTNAYERFCKNTARLHDFAGCCAIFITVVNFGVLDSSTEMWNVVSHLTNSIFIGFDLLNNNIESSMESYKWNISWIYLFIIFTWGIVESGVKPWPYFFLNTDKSAAYAWYEGLLILNFIFFLIWFYICRLKFIIASKFEWISFKWHHSLDVSDVNKSNENVEIQVVGKLP